MQYDHKIEKQGHRTDFRKLSKHQVRISIAFHEAGHAVVGWIYGERFSHIEISNDNSMGRIVTSKREFRSKSAFYRARQAFARGAAGGPLAEAIFLETIQHYHFEELLWSSSDFTALSAVKGPKSYCALTHPITWEVKELLKRQDVKFAIAILAGILVAKGRVDEDSARSILKACIPVKWPKQQEHNV